MSRYDTSKHCPLGASRMGAHDFSMERLASGEVILYCHQCGEVRVTPEPADPYMPIDMGLAPERAEGRA